MSDRQKRRLPQKSPKGVAKIDPPARLDRSKVNWDDLRVFAAVADSRTLRGAAARLGMQSSTVSRRIKVLEDSLGASLLVRSPDGVHLTQLGNTIFERARDLGLAVANIERDVRGAGPEISGLVRISITEGLGVYWLVPRLIEYQRAHPKLVIDAKCSMEISDMLGVETDLSVQLRRPNGDDLSAMRLGMLHVLPFASKEYAEQFGVPRTAAEFAQHKLISQAANQVQEDGLLRAWGITQPEGKLTFRTNSSVTHAALVKKGAGIGALASYAAVIDRTLVPIEIDGIPRHALQIWLTFHPGVRNIPHVAAMIEWVQANFDKNRFPWFRDEYIPVAQLRALSDEDWKVNVVDFV